MAYPIVEMLFIASFAPVLTSPALKVFPFFHCVIFFSLKICRAEGKPVKTFRLISSVIQAGKVAVSFFLWNAGGEKT